MNIIPPDLHFANPAWLYLLIIIPLLLVWYIFRQFKGMPALHFSNTFPFAKYRKTFKQYCYHILFALRMLVLALLIVILARPQTKLSRSEQIVEGIDIIFAIDVSGSMKAADFSPNRLGAAKKITEQFIDARKTDRMGLVVFSGEAYTQCPLTIDHTVLKTLLAKVKNGIIEDGTALGDGLGTAVSRIKDSKAKSKVIILLTDGVNNMGAVSPAMAAEAAKTFGIRIYTIGVGAMGYAPYPIETPFGIQYQNVPVEIDEPLMKQISAATGGEYFRATNNKSLQNVFDKIDKLEKSKIDVLSYHNTKDEYFPFLAAALALLFLEIFLRWMIFKRIP